MSDLKASCQNEKNSCVPDVLSACYSFKSGESEKKGFKGQELAAAMDCTAKVACNKLNEDNEHNVPTLKDAVKLTSHFDDDRILKSWAEKRGFLLVPKVSSENGADEEVLESLINLSVSLGEMGQEYRSAREDGIITNGEYEKIKSCANELMSNIAAFDEIIKSQVREIKTPKLVG